MAVLPPGVSSADFAFAIEQFATAVGRDWVRAEPTGKKPATLPLVVDARSFA